METPATSVTSVKIVIFIATFFVEGVAGIQCYVGSSGYTIKSTGCTYCITTTNHVGTILGCVTTCTPMTWFDTQVTCCQTDNCNSGGSLTTRSSGITCYDDTQPDSVSSGCVYCMTTTSSTIGTLQSCVSSCTPINSYDIEVTCCQMDYCNSDWSTTLRTSPPDGVTCYDNTADGSIAYGCVFCKITSTLSGASATIVQTCASSCTNSMSVTQQIFCCTSDFCNAPTSPPPAGGSGPPGTGPPGTGPPNGLRCYSDLSGNSGTTASNCGYCITTILTITGTTSRTQSCVPTCVPLNVAGSQVQCCQTDLCNVGMSGSVTTFPPPSRGGSDGLICYNDPTGRSGSAVGGCGYCMNVTTMVAGLNSTIQSCAPACKPI